MVENTFQQLSRPFSPDKIKWRPGHTTKDGKRALALAYIDARDVQERLDEVFGPFNWQSHFKQLDNGTVICRLEIFHPDRKEWVCKEDGSGETTIEKEKGAISRALCRAASSWGVGRYLYDLPQVWVELDEYKKIVNPPKLPDWAIPKMTPQQHDLIKTFLQNEHIATNQRKKGLSALEAGMTEEAADRFIERLKRIISEGERGAA